ncbi:MAG: helix-turn-helix transcriptional regulator [Lachnospiraceae bacterium]|jgi:Predicted transcription factor, homolog of eukaryotic MBF1|nr:helix-turn-helix transcriptional regulator [Lachnospiraceae bacterium]
MNQTEIGQFIVQCRREKELTQTQLAEKLNITDRAISKWERGKSMPDSSIMLELCGILGITVNELLSGEKVNMENVDTFQKKADENLIELKKKDENNLTKNMVVSIIFSATLLIGILVCAICDIAISGTFTWSLIPISSIIFAWVISFPITILGKRGIIGSLLSLSLFIFLYLYILGELVEVREVFSIGSVMSAISIIYLWSIFAVFFRLRTRKWLALGITFLITIPYTLVVNISLSRLIGEKVVDVWDILTIFILLIAAFSVFVCDYAKRKGLVK